MSFTPSIDTSNLERNASFGMFLGEFESSKQVKFLWINITQTKTELLKYWNIMDAHARVKPNVLDYRNKWKNPRCAVGLMVSILNDHYEKAIRTMSDAFAHDWPQTQACDIFKGLFQSAQPKSAISSPVRKLGFTTT